MVKITFNFTGIFRLRMRSKTSLTLKVTQKKSGKLPESICEFQQTEIRIR